MLSVVWEKDLLTTFVSSNYLFEITPELMLALEQYVTEYFNTICCNKSQTQWPRGLRRRSTAARLLRSWVRIPPGAWISVCCECCVLSGRGLCDELITRPEESYRLWCVVCGLEKTNLVNEEAKTH